MDEQPHHNPASPSEQPILAPPPVGEVNYAHEMLRTQAAWSRLLWLLTVLAVLLGVSQFIPHMVEQTQYALIRGKQRAEYEQAGAVLQTSSLKDLSRAYQAIAQRINPSVVHISTSDKSPLMMPIGSSWQGLDRMGPLSRGQGSGIVVDASGLILTNYHVITGGGQVEFTLSGGERVQAQVASEIQVTLSDRRKLKASVIGIDPVTDLALLRIHATDLTPAEFADSDEVEMGAMVWAVGSPFGLERSITAGILSGKHRTELAGRPHQDFLQSDAAVNRGNSGGPLVDEQGRVVGINTAIVGDTFQGVSFAIPSNVAARVQQDLRSGRVVRRGWLGVQLDQLTEETAKSLGSPVTEGVLVNRLVDETGGESPAAKAGVEAGDIITHWNGQAVSTPAALSRLVAQSAIGSQAELRIVRRGTSEVLSIEVGERPMSVWRHEMQLYQQP
jgi:serine protease Do